MINPFKVILFASVLFLVSACAQKLPFDLAKQVEETSVEITITANNGSCSGTIINAHEVLTAGHCSNYGGWKDFIVHANGHDLIARLKKFDKEKDLAILEVPGVTFKTWVKIANVEPRLAEDVYCVGNPGGNMPDTITKGIVSFLNRTSEKLGLKNRNQMDCSIHFGNSGGGVFNKDGDLIGVISAAMTITDQFGSALQWGSNYAFIVTVKDIRSFIE